MSLAIVHSRALSGILSPPVTVEVHLAPGLPSFTLVGLAETEVKESRERVRSALLNSGFDFPSNKRITVNLAPADLPKDSGRFDLPIALGILAAAGEISQKQLDGFEFAGELSLSGELRPVRGALTMAIQAYKAQHDSETPRRGLILPHASAVEAALVPDLEIFAANHLVDVVQHFRTSHNQATSATQSGCTLLSTTQPAVAPAVHALDLKEIKGHHVAKRALKIAAAGGHSLLLVGPPGTGKSMLAQRLPGILPPMSVEEALESASIGSLDGRFSLEQWRVRPFRSPHHTISAIALIGGSVPPKPGEISLAHQGVLFLDELPEFPKNALEALREPLETGTVCIVRAAHRTEFPAHFQLIAAMNPCPCGYLGSHTHDCRCTPDQVSRYQNKLSDPFLDRIDLRVEVSAIPHAELAQQATGESSATVSEQIEAAFSRQMERQGCQNRQLSVQQIDEYCALDKPASQFLEKAATQLGWSSRSFHRILKVARTIADLDGSAEITIAHLSEAMQYRRALQIAH